VVFAENALPPCQTLLIQRQRAVFVLAVKRVGKIIERIERVGMIEAEDAPSLRKALLVKRQRAFSLALARE
jgi:hypothetical protein